MAWANLSASPATRPTRPRGRIYWARNAVANFRPELIHVPQGAGVYAHVLGNAGLYLHGGITGNAGRLGNSVVDWVQSYWKGQEGVSEMAGNAAGKRVGEQIWNYLKGGRTQADGDQLRRDPTDTLCVGQQ